jgi:tRNA 2-thiouridine synthesizing protein D
MKFTVNVCGSPLSSQAADSAYRFTAAALASQHQVERVFFYGDGVLNSNSLQCPPSDEVNHFTRWSELSERHGVELIVCIAAAVRRGKLNQEESTRYAKANHNVCAPFVVSGLGQLVESIATSDRTITFAT